MSTSSIADLVVNVSTNVASLNDGMNRVADIVSSTAKQLTGSFDDVKTRVESTQAALEKLAVVATAGFGFEAFKDFTASIIETQAHLEDLATKVGSTASQISSLAPAAKLSSTNLDDVALAVGRFTKNLATAQDGTGKVADALKNLGFNSSQFAQLLKDPLQGLVQFAQQSQQFANDGNRLSNQIVVLGKSAENLVPFLKQLADSGQLQATVTDQQSAAAHALVDQWNTLGLRSDALKNSIAAGIVPALSTALKSFSDATSGAGSFSDVVKGLAEDGSLGIWLIELTKNISVAIESLIAIGKALYAFGGSVGVVVADIKLGAAGLSASAGNTDAILSIGPLLAERNAALADANTRYESLWNDDVTKVSTALNKSIDDLKAWQVAYKKTLDLQAQAVRDYAANSDANDLRLQETLAGTNKPSATPPAGAGGKAAVADFLSAINSLQASLDKLTGADGGMSNFNTALLAISKALAEGKQFTLDQEAAYLALAGELDLATIAQKANADALKQWTDQEKTLQAAMTGYQKSLDDATNALRKHLESQQTTIEKSTATKEAAVLLGEAYKDLAPLLGDLYVDTKLLSGLQDQMSQTTDPVTIASLKTRIALTQQKIALDNVDIAQRKEDIDISRTWAAGWTDAWQKYQEGATAANAAQTAFNSLTQSMEKLFVDAMNNTANAFKTFAQSLLQTIEQLIAKQAVQSLLALFTGSFSGISAAAGGAASVASGGVSGLSGLTSIFGSSGSLVQGISNIFTSGGVFSSGLGAAFAGSGVGQALGLSSLAEFSTGATALTGLGVALGSIIPVVGILAAAASAFGLFGKGGGPKTGGFADTGSFTAGGDNNRFFTPNDSDAAVQKTVDALSKGFTDALRSLGGTGAASFGLGFDTDPNGTANSRTSVGVQVGGQNVFSQRDVDAGGRDDAALQASLATEADRALLAALQASSLPDNIAKIIDSVDAATATDDAITKILALAAAFKQATDVLGTLGDTLTNLNPDDLQGLIDAVGGIDAFTQAFKFLGDNFTTSTTKIDLAQTQLATGFDKLGLAEPNTTAGFLDLLNSLDTTTDAGKQTYASLLQLAPTFSLVAGNADDLAKALKNFPDFSSLSTGSLDSLAGAFGGAEAFETALNNVGNAFTTTARTTAANTALINSTFSSLGIKNIPTTTAALGDLIHSFDAADPAVQGTIAALVGLVPAFVQVDGSAQDAADAAQHLADQNKQAADSALQFFNSNFFSTISGQAEHLAQLGDQVRQASNNLGLVIPTTIDGFRGLVDTMTALDGANSNVVQSLLALAPATLDIANAAQKATTIIDTSNTVGDPQSIQQNVQAFLQSIATIAGNIPNSDFGQQLGEQINLITEKITEFQAQGAIFAAQGNYDYATNIGNEVKALQSQNAQFADELARYTTLTAQYGAATAKQLVDLQDSFAAQSAALSQTVGGLPGNADALAALKTVFDQQWAAIIAGTSTGVTGTIDQLQKLRDGIASYLQGLQVGSMSPLTPAQKFAQAQTDFQAEFVKAQGGDQGALGDITKFSDTLLNLGRDMFASGQQYTNLFNTVTGELGTLTGPTPKGDPLAASLPANGAKIASGDDITSLKDALVSTITDTQAAAANANTEDIAELRREVEQLRSQLATAPGR